MCFVYWYVQQDNCSQHRMFAMFWQLKEGTRSTHGTVRSQHEAMNSKLWKEAISLWTWPKTLSQVVAQPAAPKCPSHIFVIFLHWGTNDWAAKMMDLYEDWPCHCPHAPLLSPLRHFPTFKSLDEKKDKNTRLKHTGIQNDFCGYAGQTLT